MLTIGPGGAKAQTVQPYKTRKKKKKRETELQDFMHNSEPRCYGFVS